MPKRPVSIKNEEVARYAMEFYSNKRLCSLCGNHGIIDTTGVKSPAGVEVGRKNFCICPNGQAIRKATIQETGDRNSLPA
jgi:hypothetical protein